MSTRGEGQAQGVCTPKRRQCAKCPWKKTTNPYEIPNYQRALHESLRGDTIAEPGDMRGAPKMMACHETTEGRELPCIGWLANQLGPGNNIGLRLRALSDRSLSNFTLVGEQHETFEDTLPKRKRGRQ